MIYKDRMTAKMEGDFVVFLIGMRINKPLAVHKYVPVLNAMDSEGTATILLALFSGLQLEREVGLAVDTKATACAIADLFGGLLPS